MFVRIKRIRGQDYGYLVESIWTPKGPRQKVTQYLGRIIRPGPTKSESLAACTGQPSGEFIQKSPFQAIIEALVRLELHNHSMNETEVNFSEKTVKVSGRKAVLAMHDGFLCGATLQRLLGYRAEDDYTGFVLADRITAAGLKVEKNSFVALFEKMQQDVIRKEVREQEFYY